MKQQNLFLCLCIVVNLLMGVSTFAQAPQAFPYQAIARDAGGNILANQNISLLIGIIEGNIAGSIIFQESHLVTTNSLGLFTLTIGQGTPFSGNFNTINWGGSPKFIRIQMDASGGTNYVLMGTSQLMSVPYALFAEKTNDHIWTKTGNHITNSNSGNVGVGILAPTSKLHTAGSVRHEGLAGLGARIVRADDGGNLFTAQSPIIATPNASIPDNGCATGNGVTNSITLSGYPSVVPSYYLSVKVNITHPYDGDVAIFLYAPNGAILKLAHNNGVSGDNFTNTIFVDNAATSISLGTAPFTGSYKPIGGTSTTCTITPTVSTFNAIGGGGVNPNGVWTLKVIDDAGGDVGVLNSWSVEVQGYSNGGVQNYVPKWDNGVLSNTSNLYDNGTNIGIGTTTPTAKLHTTGSVRHETLSGLGKRVVFSDSVGNLVTNPPVFESNSVGGNILGNNACNNYTHTVSGAPTSVASKGISVKINLTHSYLQHLGLFLEAPNGDILLLESSFSNGSGSINAIYTDYSITYSDLPPYNGVYKANGGVVSYPCGVVANTFDFDDIANGTINPNGVWKLWVLDLGSPAGMQGSLANWSILIGDTINRGFNGYFPKWVDGNLSNGSFMYENATGVGIRASKINNELSVGGDVDITGRLAIGITSPLAPLHIGGSSVSTAGVNRAYFSASTGSNIINNTGTTFNILVRADGWVWANGGGFVATSDKRIKNILSVTNNKKDLDVLNKIEITDYKYIDEIANGSKLQKKVIAQQVQAIYPLAVNTNQGIIPNVFENALRSEVKNGHTLIETKKKHGFSNGDTVKLILENKSEKLVQVNVINETRFTVDEIIDDKIFVYGKHINDLLTVDYDALTTLNISATQELAKQNQVLKKEIEELKKAMQNQYQILSRTIEAMNVKETAKK